MAKLSAIDTESLQRWLDAYTRAWQTYAPADIGALFTEDAEYRWQPWAEGDDVARGRDAIVAAWLDDLDPPDSWELHMRPLLISGNDATAVGTCRYYTDATRSTLEKEFHNLWVMHFADDGRCRSFTEWYMQSPAT